jgi:hypothetical protein
LKLFSKLGEFLLGMHQFLNWPDIRPDIENSARYQVKQDTVPDIRPGIRLDIKINTGSQIEHPAILKGQIYKYFQILKF